MASLNRVMLIGRLGQSPEKRVTPNGKYVVNVSLATSEVFKDKSGNKQEKTEWHRLEIWDRLADIIEQYCQKGSQIYVEGSLQTREWKDKDGNKRYQTNIAVRNIQLLDSKQSEGNRNTNQRHQSYPANHDIPPDNFIDDSDPF